MQAVGDASEARLPLQGRGRIVSHPTGPDASDTRDFMGD
jgi:hypothetical protein